MQSNVYNVTLYMRELKFQDILSEYLWSERFVNVKSSFYTVQPCTYIGLGLSLIFKLILFWKEMRQKFHIKGKTIFIFLYHENFNQNYITYNVYTV